MKHDYKVLLQKTISILILAILIAGQLNLIPVHPIFYGIYAALSFLSSLVLIVVSVILYAMASDIDSVFTSEKEKRAFIDIDLSIYSFSITVIGILIIYTSGFPIIATTAFISCSALIYTLNRLQVAIKKDLNANNA